MDGFCRALLAIAIAIALTGCLGGGVVSERRTSTPPASAPNIYIDGKQPQHWAGDTLKLSAARSESNRGQPLTFEWALLKRPAGSVEAIGRNLSYR
jgi:hypothetical protein